MATLTKLSSGKFKAIVRRHGRTKSKTFTRKSDARTWSRRYEADHEKMEALGMEGAAMTFAELADQYLDQWAGRDQSIDFKVKFWRNTLGPTKVMDVTTGMVRDALDEYEVGAALRGDGLDEHGKPKLKNAGRNRQPATVNRIRSTVSAIFKYAIGKGLTNANPVCGVPSRTEDNKRIRYLSDKERGNLLAACRASAWPKLHLLVTLALVTGARLGELLGLRWSDVDFKKRQAYLYRTKNGDPRVLPLPTPAMTVLDQFREIGASLLFPSEIQPGKPFEFAKHWLKALQEAQIESFRFHDLRHSAASYLVMNGATLNETAEILGHKSIQTTMRYAHLSTGHKAKVSENVFGDMLVDGDV